VAADDLPGTPIRAAARGRTDSGDIMTATGRRSRPSRSALACAIESLEDRKLLSTVVAISGRDQLVFFDSASPETTIAKVKVKGLERRESLVGLDFRPASGQLYAVGDSSRVYQIDPTTGQATAAGAAAFDPALVGEEFGIDFNPAVDRLRVVSNADSNLRLEVDNGVVVDADAGTAGIQTDLALAYADGDVNVGDNPSVFAAAYTNNVAAGTPTTLYAIDSDNDVLVAIGSVDGVTDSPNNGALTTIGALGSDVGAIGGMDIETVNGADRAFAAMATGTRGRSGFFTVDLATGLATSVGQIGGSNNPVRDIAIVPEGQAIVVVDKNNRIHTLDSVLPNVKPTPVKISGLARREKIISLDQRPATGQVYGFSNQNRVYVIDAVTGGATAVGNQNTITVDRKAKADIDFNPSADRLRLVNTADENVRYDPTTGQVVDSDPIAVDVQVDGPLVYATTDVNAAVSPNVTGIAYGSNVAATPTTTLFAIDAQQDVLATVGTADGTTSPNTGQLFTVGALGVDVRDVSQFDIVTDGVTDRAFATFREGRGGASLYSIDLATGAATKIGALPRGLNPVGMTLFTPVVA